MDFIIIFIITGIIAAVLIANSDKIITSKRQDENKEEKEIEYQAERKDETTVATTTPRKTKHSSLPGLFQAAAWISLAACGIMSAIIISELVFTGFSILFAGGISCLLFLGIGRVIELLEIIAEARSTEQ
ncbi:hypothetical protein [Marinobacterium rhizophilum]|uniref:hypothetical protein n=1 Tax=Marinobacterium rhizophilum TaxID=420402 RepID=UPI00036D7A95|nr:hypothetical protein [Marinobacterium rhizophilum]